MYGMEDRQEWLDTESHTRLRIRQKAVRLAPSPFKRVSSWTCKRRVRVADDVSGESRHVASQSRAHTGARSRY